MSKTLYKILAERVHSMSIGVARYGGLQLRMNFVEWAAILIEELAEQNKRFNPGKFIKACNLSEDDEAYLLERFKC